MTRWRSAVAGAFWLGVPLAVLVALLAPRDVVLYLGGEVPGIGRPQSVLPDRIADMLYSYRASALAALIAVVTASLAAFRTRHVGPFKASLTACFLPTYVAGIEAMEHVRGSLRCHGMAVKIDVPTYILDQAFTSALSLGVTVVVGVAVALAFGHRSRLTAPVHPVVAAILVSVALSWYLMYHVVLPI